MSPEREHWRRLHREWAERARRWWNTTTRWQTEPGELCPLCCRGYGQHWDGKCIAKGKDSKSLYGPLPHVRAVLVTWLLTQDTDDDDGARRGRSSFTLDYYKQQLKAIMEQETPQ